jgi:hypothetical protein
MERLEAQVAQTVALIDSGLLIPHKYIDSGFMSPCRMCDYAHICDA